MRHTRISFWACRTLHGADGRFIVDNINEWQHSAMYLAFLISGVVDLVGFYAPQGTLPPGTEQVKYPALHCKSTFSCLLLLQCRPLANGQALGKLCKAVADACLLQHQIEGQSLSASSGGVPPVDY